MTHTAVTSNEAPSDLRTILEANTAWTVIFGAASPGDADATSGRFIACWPLAPLRVAEGHAAEDGGQLHRVWQLNCFAPDISTALAMVKYLTDTLGWPDGWELVNVGPAVQDTAPAPMGWFIPVDVKHTEV